MVYQPAKIPDLEQMAGPEAEVIHALTQWIEQEFLAISQEASETLALDLRESFRIPVRPRRGMIVYADGVKWDPGYGPGLYVFDGTNWAIISVTSVAGGATEFSWGGGGI